MKQMKFVTVLFVLLLCLNACEEEVPVGTTEPMPVATVPMPAATVGFAWEVRDGLAYLVGIGSVSEGDLVIPAEVRLVENADGWMETQEEDELSGMVYPVVVTGDAFNNCDIVKTVIFHRGVAVENNQMRGSRYGMFYNCKNLTKVHNLPENITSMSGAFSNCKSLQSVSGLPDTVTDMRNCFKYCESLVSLSNFPTALQYLDNCFEDCKMMERVPELPENLISMDMCFLGCANLKEIPIVPDRVTSLYAAFQGCASLETVGVGALGVTDMSQCFLDCTSLKSVKQLPPNVVNLTTCFSNCAMLETVCDIPDGAQNMTECFLGCRSLKSAPGLPDSVLYMKGCFQYCEALTGAVDLPDNVIDISQCFAECRSLVTIPEIPGSVETMNSCFLYCESLQGTITIPRIVANGGLYGPNIHALAGCLHLDVIRFDTCPYAGYIWKIKSNEKYQFIREHNDTGYCEFCGYTDQAIKEKTDMLVTYDDVDDYYKTWFTEFAENELPKIFKEDCVSITLTYDLEQFTDRWKNHQINGLASGDYAYIKCRPDMADMKYTIYHELGHCYDYQKYEFSIEQGVTWKEGNHYYVTMSYDSGGYVISQSEEWIALHEKEGNIACQWYGNLYWTYTEESRRKETFAISVGKYFTDPNALKARCPGMYEFVDNLFREALEAEAAAKAKAESAQTGNAA